MLKYDRHAKILECIKKFEIKTQEELVARLNDAGCRSTQATVSRDIRELRLIKVMSSDGAYKYATTLNETVGDMEHRLNTIFSESVLSVDHAKNIVVIKTLSGMAQAACAALDMMAYDGIVGTIAGDDTLFVAVRDDKGAGRLAVRLESLSR